MVCQSCGHEQAAGKFCGKCGTKLVEQMATAVQPMNHPGVHHTGNADPSQGATQPDATQHETAAAYAGQPQQPNIHVEKVKETSKMYWSYYLQYLKHPSKIFENSEREFINGLISIAVFAVLVSLAAFNSTPSTGFDFLDQAGPSFITVLLGTVISIAILSGVVTFALFLANRFFGPNMSYKKIVSIYGAHLTPIILLAAVSFLLLLLKSYIAGNMLMFITLGLPFILLPLYLIGRFLSIQAKGMDPLYGFLSYIILSSVLFSIVFAVLADSLMNYILDSINIF